MLFPSPRLNLTSSKAFFSYPKLCCCPHFVQAFFIFCNISALLCMLLLTRAVVRLGTAALHCMGLSDPVLSRSECCSGTKEYSSGVCVHTEQWVCGEGAGSTVSPSVLRLEELLAALSAGFPTAFCLHWSSDHFPAFCLLQKLSL